CPPRPRPAPTLFPYTTLFRSGFAPTAWDRVCAAARAKGFSAAELERAGLASRGRRGPVDRFRGRLIFPLADARGRVRGFGARQRSEEHTSELQSLRHLVCRLL